LPSLNASLNATQDSIVVTWSHDEGSDIPGYELYYSGHDPANYASSGQIIAGTYNANSTLRYAHPVYSPHPEETMKAYNFSLYASNQYSSVPADAVPTKAGLDAEGLSVPYIYELTATQEDSIVQNFGNQQVGPQGFGGHVMKPFDLSGEPDVNNVSDGDTYDGDADLSGKVWVAFRDNEAEGYTTFYIYAEVLDDQVWEETWWDPNDGATPNDGVIGGTWIHDFGAPFKDNRLIWNVYTKHMLNFHFGTYGVDYVTGSTNGLRQRGENPDYFLSYTPYVHTEEENKDPEAIQGLLNRLWLEEANLPITTEGDTTYYYSSTHEFIYPTQYEQMTDGEGNYIGWKMLAAVDAQDLIADQSQTDTPFEAPADDQIKYIPFAIQLIDRDEGSPWWGAGHEFFFNTKPSVLGEVGSSVSGIGAVAVAGIDRVITDIEEEVAELPNSYELKQNYPNPFNPSTTINFSLAKSGKVSLTVFNILGQQVAKLINQETYNAGQHSMQFNASSLSSGMYFYRIQAGEFTDTRNMLLIK